MDLEPQKTTENAKVLLQKATEETKSPDFNSSFIIQNSSFPEWWGVTHKFFSRMA
jgi:hypothetical protein